ncbi:hypothetical protein SAMN04488128_101114 [Chitinophaga eiseniae]|uniref:Uncharacterized protein n=1 Tax=Chitinophaga eiseniae TaxID=634771 RepID=A0A1T4KGC7_9BACT|nr:hypothetical protein [Chitinophaga eiseniae]SJZ41479.1 hypothetical protein SAMN04488128_101114 [Chitinophaga eiseniae]
MEKINALIEKLQELKNSGANLQAISYYVQLLQAEVLYVRNKQQQQEMQNRQDIAVIMPVQPPMSVPVTTATQTTTLPADKPEVPAAGYPQSTVAADLVPSKPEPVITAQPIPTLAANMPPPAAREPLQEPVFKDIPVREKEKEKEKAPPPATLFDQATEPEPEPVPAPAPVPAPTPAPAQAQAKPHTVPDTHGIRKDLNELVGNHSGLSLNDRLRQQQTEVAQKLGDMPVKDLRAAIGINDKYQFIQELFRGDTDLYERSVKTINEFKSLQEADYWIQREIKIIQGWQDDHHLVQHFYSLLRKRFS